ncbi:hypothetical protein B9Z55_009151 [Caenorhabditis nigoni]|uniref:Reverse transcriptase domain-containing protein n=1 Tax=Caenorhabditis nigoni TaxID=1611254 RepID=A0A2G5UQU2_9PELO|nr:hypothetical protein B9Z55_009151 [Caenorhabditis nigoni]
MLQEQKDKQEAEIKKLEQLQQEELGNQEPHQKLIPAQRFQDIVTNTTVATKTDTVAKIEKARKMLAQEKLALANRTPMVAPVNLIHKTDNHPLMDETMYVKPASPQFSSPSSYIIQSPPMEDFRHEINESIKALEERNAAVIASSVEVAVGKLATGLLEKLSLKNPDKIITDVKDLHLQDGYYDSDEDEAEALQYMNQHRNQKCDGRYGTSQEESSKSKQTPNNKSTPREHMKDEQHQYTSNNGSAFNKKYENFEKNLIRFDGSGKLSIFKRLFSDNVIKNPTLSDDEKYIQLEKHLTGPAAKCMQRLDDTRKAINLTIYELDQVYGETEDRMALHERLINLPFHQTDCKRMILDLQAHRTLVNLLEEQNLNVNDERTITPFCQKLPEYIIEKIMPVVNQDSSLLTFEMVHDAVVDAIKILKKKNTFIRSRPNTGINEIPAAHGAVFLTDHQSPYPPRYHNSNHQQQNYQSHNMQERPKNTKFQQYRKDNKQNNTRDNKVTRTPQYVASQHAHQYKDESGRILPGIYAPGFDGPNLSIIRYSFPFPVPEIKSTCNTCDDCANCVTPKTILLTNASAPSCADTVEDSTSWALAQERSSTVKLRTTRNSLVRSSPESTARRNSFFVPNKITNKLSWKAGAGATPSLHVPPITVPTSLSLTPPCYSNQNVRCSTNNIHSVSPNSVISEPFARLPKFNCREKSIDTKRFLKFLSEDKHHINHSATAVYDDEYKLPFICLYTPNGESIRALVDSGASLSLIDHRAANKIQLELLGSTTLTVAGFGSTVTIPSNVYKLPISNTLNKTINFKVAGSPQLPPTKFQVPTLSNEDVKYLKNRNIRFEHQKNNGLIPNQNIDMIMGNDIISWIQSQPTTKRAVLPSGRLLEITPLGSIFYPTPNLGLLMTTHIIDDVALKPSDSRSIVMTIFDTSDPEDPLTKLIQEVAQMWRLENIGISAPEMDPVSLKESRDLLEEFKANAKFNKEGILEVALPFNGNEKRLAPNFEIAIKRLGSLIVTLKKGNNLLSTYDDIIKEQLSKGIVDVVTEEMEQNAKKKGYVVYYIPHRAVIKMSSATTKVRIVYDASSHKRHELSLNDCVFPGPCILQSIFGILLRARLFLYIILADIEKAFHQVQMKEEFRDVTRFLWLKDITKPVSPDNIQILHFKKIPFGLASSPFLLNATILLFLQLNPHVLNEMTKENIYVDNALYYTNEKSDIRKIVKGSKKIFADMSMNLREFAVNDAEEMKRIPEKDRAKDTTIKILGYSWDLETDLWTIKLASLEEHHPTKRQVASRLAETFDPTGITTPILVAMKRLMQLCWTDKLNWNDPLTEKLLRIYRKIQEGIRHSTITVPRQVTTNYGNSKLRLMVFSDASQDMMAACVYTHYTYESGPPVVSLLCSKNKIKPANNENMTIPKMELTAIVMGTNLAIAAKKEIPIPVVEICFLTDSSISFFWILKEHTTRPYVSNRVNDYHVNKSWIEKTGTEVALLHCPTEFNPSDAATRGLTTPEYNEYEQWPHGPKFLLDGRETWPNKIEGSITNVKEFHDLVFQEVIDPVTQKRKRSRIPKPDPPKAETIMLVTPDEQFTSIVPFYRTNSMRKLVTIVHKTLLAVCKAFPNHQWESFVMKQFTKESEDQPTLRRKMARTFTIQQHYIEADKKGLSFPSDIRTFKDQDGLIRFRSHVKSSVLPAETHTHQS